MPIANYNGVRVFMATTAERRAHLGDDVTSWIAEHPRAEIVDTEVRQSSDTAFHALTIVVFFRERA